MEQSQLSQEGCDDDRRYLEEDLGSQHKVLQRETEKTYPQGNQDLESQHKALQRETEKIYPQGNQELGNKQPRGTQDTKQHATHEVTAQEDIANTSESEKIYPQNYQRAPPKLTGAWGILSACPTVVLVCPVGSEVMSHGENTLSRGRGIKSKMKQMQELTDKIYELG